MADGGIGSRQSLDWRVVKPAGRITVQAPVPESRLRLRGRTVVTHPLRRTVTEQYYDTRSCVIAQLQISISQRRSADVISCHVRHSRASTPCHVSALYRTILNGPVALAVCRDGPLTSELTGNAATSCSMCLASLHRQQAITSHPCHSPRLSQLMAASATSSAPLECPDPRCLATGVDP